MCGMKLVGKVDTSFISKQYIRHEKAYYYLRHPSYRHLRINCANPRPSTVCTHHNYYKNTDNPSYFYPFAHSAAAFAKPGCVYSPTAPLCNHANGYAATERK